MATAKKPKPIKEIILRAIVPGQMEHAAILDFLTTFHQRLNDLYSYELQLWLDEQVQQVGAKDLAKFFEYISFYYTLESFKKVPPYTEKSSYFSDRIWELSIHGYTWDDFLELTFALNVPDTQPGFVQEVYGIAMNCMHEFLKLMPNVAYADIHGESDGFKDSFELLSNGFPSYFSPLVYFGKQGISSEDLDAVKNLAFETTETENGTLIRFTETFCGAPSDAAREAMSQLLKKNPPKKKSKKAPVVYLQPEIKVPEIKLIDRMYKDINLKFALISCLNEQDLLIEDAEAVRDTVYDTQVFQRLGYDDIVPKMKRHYEKLKLDPELLGKITEFNPYGASSCYNLLVKEWSGEDDIFDIVSLDGIEFLPNLKIFNPGGLLDYRLNADALLRCEKLEIVHAHYLRDTENGEEIIQKLKEKGIEIVEN